MHLDGWRKIPDTYFMALGFEDAKAFHGEMRPADRLSGPSAAMRSKASGRKHGHPPPAAYGS